MRPLFVKGLLLAYWGGIAYTKLAMTNATTDNKTNTGAVPDKTALIEAMLVHVPFDGWTTKSLEAAASDLGVDNQTVQTLLPHGVRDALDAFVAQGDLAMAEAFAKSAEKPQEKSQKNPQEKPRGVSAKIKTLILLRLEVATPHREAVAAALKTLARPQYASLAPRIYARSIDRMWRIAGDQSVDFSFYTKRAILAGVFASCLAWWVANPNADASARETFVANRLRDAAVLPKLTAPISAFTKNSVHIATRFMARFRPPSSDSA